MTTFSRGSACSRNQPTTACPASWYATVVFSGSCKTWFFFSKPKNQQDDLSERLVEFCVVASETMCWITFKLASTKKNKSLPAWFVRKQYAPVSEPNMRLRWFFLLGWPRLTKKDGPHRTVHTATTSACRAAGNAPPTTLSTACSKCVVLICWLRWRAAKRAASLQTLAISAPAEHK